jgi:hypothetical protein
MYSLCAIVSPTREIEGRNLKFRRASPIRLEAGLSMVPLSEALLAEIHESETAAAAAGIAGSFEFLSPQVETWVRALSLDGTIAYVETEFIAGEGYERSAVWVDGKIALGPLDETGAINKALKALGIRATAGQEEFHVVGLGRHRTLDEWLHEV